MPYTAAPAAVQTSASRAYRKWSWRESACLRLLLECTCRSKPPWATSQNRETSPVCSPKRLQKASRSWLNQRKLMRTGPFWRRERDRRKCRHHCRAKIGDEFTLSLVKNSHNWRWAYTFPCQKFALFVTLPVSPFTDWSPLWRWNSQWVHTFHCQKFFRPLCSPLSNGTSRVTSDRKPKTNDQILFCSSHRKMNQINTKNYWK